MFAYGGPMFCGPAQKIPLNSWNQSDGLTFRIGANQAYASVATLQRLEDTFIVISKKKT